jgi:hypothetical protein
MHLRPGFSLPQISNRMSTFRHPTVLEILNLTSLCVMGRIVVDTDYDNTNENEIFEEISNCIPSRDLRTDFVLPQISNYLPSCGRPVVLESPVTLEISENQDLQDDVLPSEVSQVPST